jgi:hypothetical protein
VLLPGGEEKVASTPSDGELTAQQQQQRALAQAALHAPIPHFYANGFGLAQTATDITLILLSNTAPIGTLTMTYGLLKQAVDELSKAVSNFEKASGHEITPIGKVNEELQKLAGQGNAIT